MTAESKTPNTMQRMQASRSDQPQLASLWRLARTADGVHSPETRAERAKPKSRRDDMIIAQVKRGTSAALGCEPKMIFSLFSNLVWRRNAPNQIGKKRDWLWGCVHPGRRPQRPCPWLLAGRPWRGSGGQTKGGRPGGFGRRSTNHRLQARPGFARLFVRRPRPDLREPPRYSTPTRRHIK